MKYLFYQKSWFSGIRYLSKGEVNYAINTSKIDIYKKVRKLKVGDYVTCCDSQDALINENTIMNKGAGYRKNYTFKVTRVSSSLTSFYCYGGINNQQVNIENLRMATPQEIEKKTKK